MLTFHPEAHQPTQPRTVAELSVELTQRQHLVPRDCVAGRWAGCDNAGMFAEGGTATGSRNCMLQGRQAAALQLARQAGNVPAQPVRPRAGWLGGCEPSPLCWAFYSPLPTPASAQQPRSALTVGVLRQGLRRVGV